MKVGHIITSLEVGGAEKLLVDSIPFYQKRGIDLDVISLTDKRTRFRSVAEDYGIKIRGLTKGSVYNPLLIFKILRVMGNYDIIHAHLFPVLYWAVFAKLLSFSSTKLIYTEHSTTNNRRNNFIFKLIDRFVYQFVDTVICISTSTKENLVNHLGYQNSNFDVIYNGVDLSKIVSKGIYDYLKVELRISSNDVVLIQIASFRKAKDQSTVLKALAILPKNIKCIFLGEGKNMNPMIEEAKLLNICERTYFQGNVDNVKDYLSISDIVIVSSIYEGFGIAAVEGMANGKPVIATDVEGLSEIVSGVGLLFKVGDYESLAKYIMDLCSDSALYNKLSFAAFEKAKEFSISSMVDNYIKIYEKQFKKL